MYHLFLPVILQILSFNYFLPILIFDTLQHFASHTLAFQGSHVPQELLT